MKIGEIPAPRAVGRLSTGLNSRRICNDPDPVWVLGPELMISDGDESIDDHVPVGANGVGPRVAGGDDRTCIGSDDMDGGKGGGHPMNGGMGAPDGALRGRRRPSGRRAIGDVEWGDLDPTRR